jgi:hypothetical protein
MHKGVGRVHDRTIKDAAVKRFLYDDHDQLRQHLDNLRIVYNFSRRLKTLNGLASYEFICKNWTSYPNRFWLDPIHQMPGLNFIIRAHHLVAGEKGGLRNNGFAAYQVTSRPRPTLLPILTDCLSGRRKAVVKHPTAILASFTSEPHGSGSEVYQRDLIARCKSFHKRGESIRLTKLSRIRGLDRQMDCMSTPSGYQYYSF